MSEYETTTAPLINHALKQMLDEKGRDGWELVDVEEFVAEYRRPVDGGHPWEYAAAPLIPAARDVILSQWTERGFELVTEVDGVGYFKRPVEA